MWYDMHVVKSEYHALFNTLHFLFISQCTKEYKFPPYCATRYSEYRSHWLHNTIKEILSPSMSGKALHCNKYVLWIFWSVATYFKGILFGGEKNLPILILILILIVNFLLHYLSLSELSRQGRMKLAHSYGWDNPVFFGWWITPDYSVINPARAKPSWSRSDFHQQGVGNFGYNELITLKKHVVTIGQAWS